MNNIKYTNTKEKWSISVQTEDEAGEALEVSKIIIIMPGGKKWEGTINDLQAAFYNPLELS